MPKIVDHEARRQEIVAATMRVVERVGLEGVTIREIAREAGCSAGILAHYFKNKDDILVTAHVAAFAQVIRRIDALRERIDNPVDLMRRALEEALPLDPPRHLEAKIDVSFWGLALHDDRLREVREQSYESGVAAWQEQVEVIVAAGLAREDTDAAAVARETAALIDGISIEAVLFPTKMTPERQLAAIEHHLASFTRVEARSPR
ncbi:MAG: TetR/AcrR family transcriptional regulator [Nocardioides sp.]|uniref:TetR/AcrR family transcriptional regulator n=1 Tax=Nocardioides sp. TaxID=35761 RepID=UPI0039E5B9FF